MKKNIAIVFGITDSYVFALANTLIGLKKHSKPFWDDIIVYHDGIDEKIQQEINKIMKCHFIEYNEEVLPKDLNKESVKNYSLLTLARFECFALLNEYKKIMWHDVDILIQKDISSLTEYGNKTGIALTKSDCGFLVENNFYSLIPEYNMFTLLYNAGIMVITDQLKDYERIYKWCYQKTNELGSKLRFLDQGIINLLVQEFKLDVEKIDINKYCCHPSKKNYKDAYIIHAYGKDKFWNSLQLSDQFPEWEENNKEWENMTAKKLDLEKKETLPKISVILSVYNRDKFLQEALDSILNQTYTHFEIIIVVEKSEEQDRIAENIEKIADPRIKVIKNKEKLGFAASLNVALEMATGTYIARMDDDDISLPMRFEKQINLLESKKEYDMCGTDIEFFMGNTGICRAETDNEILKIITLFRCPFFHPTVMIRKSSLDKYQLRYDPNYFTEDYELWSRTTKYFKSTNIPEVLLKYRASNENTSLLCQEKVTVSHYQTMKKQFKEYLKLEPTDDEIALFSARFSITKNLYNVEEAMQQLQNFCNKIKDANKKIGYYDQGKLEKILKEKIDSYYLPPKKSRIKEIIKKMVRPIYSRLMIRVKNYVDNEILILQEKQNKKITELYKEIDKLKEKNEKNN